MVLKKHLLSIFPLTCRDEVHILADGMKQQSFKTDQRKRKMSFLSAVPSFLQLCHRFPSQINNARQADISSHPDFVVSSCSSLTSLGFNPVEIVFSRSENSI